MLNKTLLTLAVASMGAGSAMAQSSSCLGPNATSASFVEGVKQALKAPANPESIRSAASSVTLVTSAATCDSAVAAFNQVHSLAGGNAVSALYVAKFPGKNYIVWRSGDLEEDWFALDWTYQISAR